MSVWNPTLFTGRHIVVTHENPSMVAMIVMALRADGHAVFHAYDEMSATQLVFALQPCDMVITNTQVEGANGIELIHQLRKRMPSSLSSISPIWANLPPS